MSRRDGRGLAGCAPRGGDTLYLAGFIGALVYYIHHTHSFWEIILAILKSLAWPAFLTYHLLQFIAA